MAGNGRDVLRRVVIWAAIAAVTAAGLAVRINVAAKHRLPRGDEGPWLRCASTVWSGAFMQSRVVEHDQYPRREIPHPEDNRSPLFPILIAVAGLAIDDLMVAGQALNLTISAAITLLAAGFALRRFGAIAGFGTALFLSVSPLFIVYATEVYADLLVALGLAVALVYAPRSMRSIQSAAVAGALFGALFLLKATAVFLAPAYLWYWWRSRKEAAPLLRGFAWLLFAMLFVAPWLARNMLAFGSPLHQFANYHLFTERFMDVYQIGLPRPSLGRYLQQHGSLHVFIGRPLWGLIAAIRIFPWFDHYLSLALLPFAGAGIVAIRKDYNVWLPWLLFSAAFLPMTAYFAYAVWVCRFTMVYYLAIYVLAGIGLAKLTAFAARYGRHASRACAGACLALPLLTVVRPMEFYASSRGSERTIDTTVRGIIAEMQSLAPDSEAVLSSIAGDYAYLHRMGVVRILDFKDWQTLREFIEVYRIGQALLSEQEEARILELAHASEGRVAFVLVKRENGWAWYRAVTEKQPAVEHCAHSAGG